MMQRPVPTKRYWPFVLPENSVKFGEIRGQSTFKAKFGVRAHLREIASLRFSALLCVSAMASQASVKATGR
jgi:hypothetical protein